MTDTIRLKGSISRIGGDEFVILLEQMDIEELHQIILKIKQAVYEILPEKNSEISIGYSLFPNDGINFKELIKIADKKMYDDKQRRKDL